MVSLIEAVILSIIQGVTEWIPVSSSGHLALMQEFLGFQDLSYDIFLHLASLFAVFILFRKDILTLLKFDKPNLNYLLLLIVALIPAGIVGLIFRDRIESLFSNLFFLGLFFIFSGIIIYSTKFSSEKKEKITFFDSVFIGIFQTVAILPGVSRSGMTISSALFRGLEKKQAIKFSFILSIPLILGASLLSTENLILSEISYSILMISFFITLITSLITIKILIKILKSDKFYLFGFYNTALGILVLIWSFIR